MTNVLKDAIAEVATLPTAAQERIGQELLAHVRKLRSLRADLDQARAYVPLTQALAAKST